MKLVLLLLIPGATGVLMTLNPGRRLAHWLNALGSVLTLVAGILVALPILSGFKTVEEVGGLFRVDPLSSLLVMVIVIVGAMASLYSINYMEQEFSSGAIECQRLRWYYLWLHVFILTMLLAVLVDNLGLMWVAIEATTLVSALLVGFNRQQAALEAAWKYIIICTVGICLALMGTIIVFAAAQQAVGEANSSLNWTKLMEVAPLLSPGMLKLAFIFLLVGYGTKTGLAPMHTWLPDAHSQAPSPVSALLSGVLLNCALYGIIRFHIILSSSAAGNFSGNLLLLFGFLSMGIAVPFILMQRDIKRMLAYSSVEHMGIMAVGLGLGGPLAVFGALLHLINHAVTKALLFLVAGTLVQRYHTHQIGRIKGVVQAMPVTGTLLLLGSFAITGSPPFGLFVSEFSMLTAGADQGRLFLMLLFLLFIGTVFAGFAYYVGKMSFGRPVSRISRGEELGWNSLLMILPVVAILILGIYIPPVLVNALEVVAKLVQGV